MVSFRPTCKLQLILLAFAFFLPPLVYADDWQEERELLIENIVYDVINTARFIGNRDLSPEEIESLATTPRHEFVPAKLQQYAYLNRPLPIGYGQTISQPYIVALMTNLLETEPDHVVLEVGTGSGYQAAILSPLVAKVYTIEIIEPLAESVTERLAQLEYDNIEVKHADGFYGWPEHGPFDSIIITAAGGQIPPPLIEQLKYGGRMVLPIGGPFSTQYLMLVIKDYNGHITTRQVLPVRFVPLTGEH
ncbi:MAG: protein-L-isoaspartate O-methyltransferase [Moraxellaceae bacterium]|nr:MAG: protein-L-isoaspartate O-methyltransferase [Moraxellaceae bacterium]